MANLTKGVAAKVAKGVAREMVKGIVRKVAKSPIDGAAKRVLWLVCAVFFIGLFGACAGNPPSWFLAQHQSSTKLYGVGAGSSLASAKQEAINDLAQSVQSKISASTQLQNTLDDERYSSTLAQNIHISSADLPLQNLQIINKSYAKGTYYVQVGISRADILAPLQKSLQEILGESKHISASCISIRDFALLESSLARASGIVQILQSLDTKPPREFARLETLYASTQPAPALRVELKNVLEKELFLAEIAKFAQVSKASTQENLPSLELSMQAANGQKDITLHALLRDCQGRVLAQTSIHERQNTQEYALKRSAIVLYKWLDEVAKGEE